VDSNECSCNGRKHILTEDGWIPCPCLNRERYDRNISRAGIPVYMTDMTWKAWAKRHASAARIAKELRGYFDEIIREGRVQRSRCLYGPASSGKVTLAYLFLKECIKRGLTGRTVLLGDLVRGQFDDNRELLTEMLNVDVAIVRLGMEEEHKWNGPTLERLHFTRKAGEKATIYTTRDGPGIWTAKYGDVISNVVWEPKADTIVWNLASGKTVVP